MSMIPVPAPPPVLKPRRTHGLKIAIAITAVAGILLLVFAISTIYVVFKAADRASSPAPLQSSSHIQPDELTDEVTEDIGTQLNEAQENKFSLHNNFSYLFQLEQSQEEFLGVAIPPEDATRVTAVRGIPFYETACRPYQEEEITQLALFLNTLPKEVLELRPKGIVSACLDGLNLSLDPLTNALTSGPYIYLGDEFFSGTVFSGEHSENEKLAIFAHEYAHVLQYYHIHQYWLQRKRTSAYEYDTASTVVYDFAKKVGWEPIPNTPEHSFFTPDYTWQLSPAADAQMTTTYGKESGPTEDFAESFGLVTAGQPQTISEARKQYILGFLGATEEAFTRHVVPQFPLSVRVSFDYEKYLSDKISLLPALEETITDIEQWGIDKSTSFETLVTYYTHEMENRSFTALVPLTQHPGIYNDQFATGLYRSDDKTYAILIVGTITTGITEVPNGSNRMVIERSTLTPEMYNVTVLTYD